MPLDFDRFRYFPSLRSRQWEMKGYAELSDDCKDQIAPMIVVCNHGRVKAARDVGAKMGELMHGRPYIIDLEQSPIYACDDTMGLLDSRNAFENWRNFVASQGNIVPTAIWNNTAATRDVVRQAIQLEAAHGQFVVRSRAPTADLPVLTSIISAIDAINNVLVVLDFGYIRTRVRSCTVEAATIINALRDIDEGIRVVVLGSSYPKSVGALSDAGTALEIEERTLHDALGGDSVAIYGDYASIHPEPFEPMQARFVPKIDYPLPDTWIFRRVRADQGGFQACARLITALADWDPRLVGTVWGADKINAAANGDLTGMGAPGPWIAVRVNLHLWQQIASFRELPEPELEVLD